MKLFNGLRLFLVVSLAMFAMVAGCVKSNPMTAESHSGSGVDIVAYVQGVAVKDSITPGVIMLCAQLADTIADSTISTITWQIVGGAVIGVKYTHVQTMWVPDTGHYTVQVTVLRKNGTSLQNMRNFIVYKSGVVSVPVLPGDSIFTLTYGKKTVNGFLPVTIRIATTIFTNSSMPTIGNSAKFILWGPGKGESGKMFSIDTAKNVTYKYIQDTVYPNAKYNGCGIVQWNNTNANSFWSDSVKCAVSKYYLPDSTNHWAFRFMTPSGDTVYVPDTSLMAGTSGDSGSFWVMRMKIIGDTTTYFFNPSLSTTSMASFIKNGVVTTLNLTSANSGSGTVYYLKLSRAQVQAQVSSDGYIHISYDGSSMTGSVFYQASSGNLAYFFALAKKKA